MECRRVEERLSDHLEGTLDALLDAELRAHLEDCDLCRELRAAMSEVIDALRDAPAAEPSAGLAARAADAALRAHRRRPRRVGLPSFVGLPPWVLATAAVLALALSTGLAGAAGGRGALHGTSRIAQRVSAVGVSVAERWDRLVEDFRVLRVLVGTTFEGRMDRVNDRVEDYRRLLERRQREEQAERTRGETAAPSPVTTPGASTPAGSAPARTSEPAPGASRK
jgi:predicted anti-sigma-YlaC factor YlaD